MGVNLTARALARFEHQHLTAGADQARPHRQAGKSCSDDDDALLTHETSRTLRDSGRRRKRATGGNITRKSSSKTDLAALTERARRATGARSVTLEGRLQSLWGGYGELWRATLEHADRADRVVIKLVQPPEGNDEHRRGLSYRRKLRSYQVEQAFYARYAPLCASGSGCRVARPLGADRHGESSLLVLEDLDAAGFSQRPARAEPARIDATLRWLAAFHARFLGHAPEQLWKVGSYWHLATRPEEACAMKHAPLREAAPRIDAQLNAARFKTLVHGDAKLDNVCFAPDGPEVALVDFQYVGGGVGVKDVAYFLNGCLSPRSCESLVPGYLDDYFRELGAMLRASGSGVDAALVEREWRALFPVAWVDFYRFLLGWSPGQFDADPYSERLTRDVLSALKSG
jgi:hypothetical protein